MRDRRAISASTLPRPAREQRRRRFSRDGKSFFFTILFLLRMYRVCRGISCDRARVTRLATRGTLTAKDLRGERRPSSRVKIKSPSPPPPRPYVRHVRSPRTIYGNSIRRGVLPLVFSFFFHSLFRPPSPPPPPPPLFFLNFAARDDEPRQACKCERGSPGCVRRGAVILRQCRVCNAISGQINSAGKIAAGPPRSWMSAASLPQRMK